VNIGRYARLPNRGEEGLESTKGSKVSLADRRILKED